MFQLAYSYFDEVCLSNDLLLPLTWNYFFETAFESTWVITTINLLATMVIPLVMECNYNPSSIAHSYLQFMLFGKITLIELAVYT